MNDETAIAVVGIGCRFAGQVNSAHSLWELATNRADVSGPIPSTRCGRDEAVRDTSSVSRGFFLDGDPWAWDPAQLCADPVTWASTDPHARVLQEVTWEAMDRAGIPIDPATGLRADMYAALSGADHPVREARPAGDRDAAAYLAAGRTGAQVRQVTAGLAFDGAALAVDADGPGGLIAVWLARAALLAGDCDLAVAGAAELMLTPLAYQLRRSQLSAVGIQALPGEAAAALVLKRLTDARRDRDPILAVILDVAPLRGKGNQGLQQMLQGAGTAAALQLLDLSGLGTHAAQILQDGLGAADRHRLQPLSPLPVVGHTGCVSDLTSLILAAQTLSHTRTTSGDHLQPEAKTPRSELAVVRAATAYAVMQASPPPPPEPHDGNAMVFLLSADTPEALAAATGRLGEWALGDSAHTSLTAAAHTLATRRRHHQLRQAIIARTAVELAERCRRTLDGAPAEQAVAGRADTLAPQAGAVFVFSGQGSQWPGMGRALLDVEPAFTQTMDDIEPLVAELSGISVRHLLTHPEELLGVERIQPVLFAVQVALANLWRSWGVHPSAVIGQSLGEVAAAVVAGALSLADGVTVVCRRAPLLAKTTGGAMASVLLDRDTVQATIEAAGADDVCVAVETSPQATVIAGTAAGVRDLVTQWEACDVTTRMIDVDVASHSAQMDPILEQLAAAVTGIKAREPYTPLYTTVGPDPRDPGLLNPDYWVRNQRQTVRFRSAVEAAVADGYRLFIECAPHPLVARAISATAASAGADVIAIGTTHRGQDDQETFLQRLATLHCLGHHVDWESHYSDGYVIDIPTRTWQRQRHGGEQPYSMVPVASLAAAQHPLLGGHVHDPHRPHLHLWQSPVSPRRQPWLAGNRLADATVIPVSGIAAMLAQSVSTVLGADTVQLQEVALCHTIAVDSEPTVTTQAVIEDDSVRLQIVTGVGGNARTCVQANAVRTPTRANTVPAETPEAARWRAIEAAALQHHLRHHHEAEPGPALAGPTNIRIHPVDDLAYAELDPGEPQADTATAALDAAINLAIAVWIDHYAINRGPIRATGIDALTLHRHHRPAHHIHLRLTDVSDQHCLADVGLTTADGTLAAAISGLRLTRTAPTRRRRGTP
ncbi:acyltransferase domain-containing protein [Streptomyces sp. NPDC050658]|uniref:acyltransferase domain-containing protein n=1 Tax=unclassified Streptomyces TaxID=2593676 RepID=UPI00343F10B7